MQWSDWISSLTGEEFVTAHIDDALDLVDVSEEWLIETAASGKAFYPYYTLAKESKTADPSMYSLPPLLSGVRLVTEKGLKIGLESGYTLKSQFLEIYRPELLDMVESLRCRLKGRSTVYGFLTPADTRGLSVHRDASSVVVLQVEGSKTWHVWQPSFGSLTPSAPGLVADPTGTEHRFSLSPGDAMFLPFGWPHAAEAGDQNSSFHLTWTIDQLSPSQLSLYRERAAVHAYHRVENLVDSARIAYGYGG